jgi:hypothetical protein
MSQPEAVKDNPPRARSTQRPLRFSLKGREVGVRAAMLVAPPEQVSHNRSLASSAIDRALPLDALRGSGAGVAAWRGMQLTAHTRPATDRKQRGAALGTVALPTGATVGQSYLACVGNRDLCSADASTLRSRIGRGWRRVGHAEQHIRRGWKDHLHCPRSGRLIAVERSCADTARTPHAWRSTRA